MGATDFEADRLVGDALIRADLAIRLVLNLLPDELKVREAFACTVQGSSLWYAKQRSHILFCEGTVGRIQKPKTFFVKAKGQRLAGFGGLFPYFAQCLGSRGPVEHQAGKSIGAKKEAV